MASPGSRRAGEASTRAAGAVAAHLTPGARRAIGLIGNFNADLVLGPVERMPAWDEELAAEGGALLVAGAAGYLALAAQALGLEPRIVSTLGDDAVGRLLLADLRRRGILTGGISVIAGEPSALSAVLVGPDGRRGIATVAGAHRRMDLSVYRGHRRFLAACAEVVLCGTYLLPSLGPAEALAIARDARARGQVVAFDPSWDPAGWPEATRRDTLALLAEVDVYLPNEAELCRLTGAASWEDGLDQVARLCPETVVKLGPGGAAALADLSQTGEGGGVGSQGGLVRVPALPVTAVNTIGAGDCFDAAYLWARRQGWPMARRLQFANAYAGLVAARPDRATVGERDEGGKGYPTAEEATAAAQC